MITRITSIENNHVPLDLNLSHRTIVMEIHQMLDTCMGDIANQLNILFKGKYSVLDMIDTLNIPLKVCINSGISY